MKNIICTFIFTALLSASSLARCNGDSLRIDPSVIPALGTEKISDREDSVKQGTVTAGLPDELDMVEEKKSTPAGIHWEQNDTEEEVDDEEGSSGACIGSCLFNILPDIIGLFFPSDSEESETQPVKERKKEGAVKRRTVTRDNNGRKTDRSSNNRTESKERNNSKGSGNQAPATRDNNGDRRESSGR